MRKTQTAFGAMLKVTKAMVVSYESGKAKPDDLFLSRLSKASLMPVEKLTGSKLTEEDFVELKGIELEKSQISLPKNAMFSFDSVDSEKIESKKGDAYLDKYIAAIEDRLKDLKQENQFLQRMMESSLNSLASSQQIVLSEIKAGVRLEAEIQAKGDKRKVDKILAEHSKVAFEYYQQLQVKDKSTV